MRHITAKELRDCLDKAEARPLLLDVREPWEYELCAIEGSRLLPMGQIPNSLDQLDQEQEIVVICHHGMRSQQVGYYLTRAGFDKIINLHGGINAWAVDVDPTMARY